MDMQSSMEKKRQTAEKLGRIWYDNDGGDVFYSAKRVHADDLLASRTKPALQAGADTYIYTTGWGFGIGLHKSLVGSTLVCTRGIAKENKAGAFVQSGTDCLKITAEYVRSQKKTFLWGMRMNDTHDAGYDGVHLEDNQFKNQNRDVLFGKRAKHGAHTAVDYESEKVRNFGVRYIMDVVDRYPIDGIFLDFFRHPIFFRSNAFGEKADDAQRAAMTSFMESVSNGLRERSRRDQCRYLLTIRVPDSIEYSNDIGIDLEKWLSLGLIDAMSVSSYIKLNPWEASVALAKKYDVPLYPALDESRVPAEMPRFARNCLKAYLGRIRHVWRAGCDGVFMFNHSGLRALEQDERSTWYDKEAGDFVQALTLTRRGPDEVNRMSKRYFVSIRGEGRVAGGALPHLTYINVPTLNRAAPITVPKDEKIEIGIPLSDDFDDVCKSVSQKKARMTLIVKQEAAGIKVWWNDLPIHWSARQISDPADETLIESIITAEVPFEALRTGDNMVAVTAKEQTAVHDCWLDLDYE